MLLIVLTSHFIYSHEKLQSWNRENPKIEQSDLDGTNRVVLLRAPAVNLPNSLAISSRTGELCYADAGTQKVECIEPYRHTVRTIATDLSYPFGLTVTNERLYWTDWTTYVLKFVMTSKCKQ